MKTLTRTAAITLAFVAPFCVAAASECLAADAPSHPAPAAAGVEDTAGASQTREVLGKLHHSNQKEIEMGRLAKENGRSQQVKDFGDTLVNDHTAADEKVAALARKKEIDLSAATPPMENAKDVLEPGPDFDKHFRDRMLEDHKKDIESVKSARDQTSDQDLKELLTELLPTLEKHRDTAEALK